MAGLLNPESLTRSRALLLVVLVWAAIYLPALGSLEIKGEEGRRILPAVAMLETGDWIVPHVGGEPYLSKPPLINWLIALSFKISGRQNEWAARAPTVLAVLALGLGLAWRGGAWLGPGGGLLAAIFTLTNVGLMEKGRLAEIEGLYVACFGLALVDWLAAWRLDESPWRRWLLPAFFLGLGLLTKGPLHLLFFYAIVASVLWRAGRLREELGQPAHFVGVALMLGMFAAWAVPYWQALPHNRVGSAWSAQFTGRLKADHGFRLKNWIQNVPRGLFNFIPWAVFLPLLWQRETDAALATRSPADAALLRGARPALALCFLVVLLLPGGLPRYTLPLLVPAAVLLAMAVQHLGADSRWLSAWQSSGRFEGRDQTQPAAGNAVLPALSVAALMAMITLLYAVFVVPRLRRHENLRGAAGRVNKVVKTPGAGPLFVLAPGYQPFLFYLHPAPRYLEAVTQLPQDAGGFLLLKNEALAAAAHDLGARGITWQNVLTFEEKNRGRYALLRLGKSEADNR